MSHTQAEIDSILNEVLDSAPVDAPVVQTPIPVVPAAVAPQVPVQETAATAPEEIEGANQPAYIASILSRLNERERKLAEREKALEAKPVVETPASKKWTAATKRANISEWLRAEGFDPHEVYRAGMAEILPPDKVPAEYRRLAEKMREAATLEEKFETLQSGFESLRERQEESVASSEVARYKADYSRQLDEHVKGVSDSTHPHAALVFKVDPEGALEEVREIIAKDATAKLVEMNRTGIPAAPMTPEEALKIYEDQQAKLAARFAPIAQTPPGQAGRPAVQTAPPRTLNSNVASSPPLTPPQDVNDTDARLKGALDWFMKLP